MDDIKILTEKQGLVLDYKGHKSPVFTWARTEWRSFTTGGLKFKRYIKVHGLIDIYNAKKTIELQDKCEKLYEKRNKPKKAVPKKKAPSDTKIKNLEDLIDAIDLNIPTRKEEIILLLSVIISQWFHYNDSIFLVIVAPPETGKSTLAMCFPDSKFTLSTSDVTMEAFAPGSSEENKKVHALLDDVESKTLFIDDLTPILTSTDKKIERFFGMLDGSYGPNPFKKYSPGLGNQPYGGHYNFVFGVIPEIYYDNIKDFHRTQKCLIYELQPINDVEIIKSKKDEPDLKRVRECIHGLLINLKKRDKLDFEIPDEVEDYIINFSKLKKQYELVHWDKKKQKFIYKSEYRPQGIKRIWGQLKMLLKAKCFIEGKTEVDINDVDYFKPLFYGLDNELKRLIKLEILESNGIEVDYNLFDVIPPEQIELSDHQETHKSAFNIYNKKGVDVNAK